MRIVFSMSSSSSPYISIRNRCSVMISGFMRTIAGMDLVSQVGWSALRIVRFSAAPTGRSADGPTGFYHRREAVPTEVVCEVAPVGSVENEHVGPAPRREPPDIVHTEHVGRVGRARAEGLGGGEPQAGTRQVHDQRQRLAEGTAGIEVGSQGDDGSLFYEQPGAREREIQEQAAGREQDGGDVAPGQ